MIVAARDHPRDRLGLRRPRRQRPDRRPDPRQLVDDPARLGCRSCSRARRPAPTSSEVGRAMAGVPGVREVHDLHVWTITSGFPALAAHVARRPRHRLPRDAARARGDAARALRARAHDAPGRPRGRRAAPDRDVTRRDGTPRLRAARPRATSSLDARRRPRGAASAVSWLGWTARSYEARAIRPDHSRAIRRRSSRASSSAAGDRCVRAAGRVVELDRAVRPRARARSPSRPGRSRRVGGTTSGPGRVAWAQRLERRRAARSADRCAGAPPAIAASVSAYSPSPK